MYFCCWFAPSHNRNSIPKSINAKYNNAIQYNTTLLPSVNTIALGMFCGAKYTRYTFTPNHKTSLNYNSKQTSPGKKTWPKHGPWNVWIQIQTQAEKGWVIASLDSIIYAGSVYIIMYRVFLLILPQVHIFVLALTDGRVVCLCWL